MAEVELEYARRAGDHDHLRCTATLIGAAESARRILRTQISPVRASVRERLVSEVQSQLASAEYERAYMCGGAMSLEVKMLSHNEEHHGSACS